MKQYIVRRLLEYIPIMIVVAMIIFLIVALIPGDYIDNVAGANPRYTPEKIAAMKAKYGFDKPVVERFIIWLGNALRLDFGESLSYQKPVTEVIGYFMWNSFLIAFLAFLLETLIGIPIGIISATRQYSKTDFTVTAFALVGLSMPSFFLGLLLKKIFCIDLKLLPLAGMRTLGADLKGVSAVWDIFLHMLLPVIVLALLGIGSWMMYTRSAMLDVIKQDYIRTARAKGLSERIVIYKHALRNAMIPIVNLLGMSIPALFTGALITEQVFAFPGVGKITIEALTKRDYMFVVGFNLFSALMLFLGNLLSDIMMAMVDPRIKLK
ncbi:MAG: ABC transporter permease [Clostridia bacterium]|nr:ABC transporter permease [Clostridia bacterium]